MSLRDAVASVEKMANAPVRTVWAARAMAEVLRATFRASAEHGGQPAVEGLRPALLAFRANLKAARIATAAVDPCLDALLELSDSQASLSLN